MRPSWIDCNMPHGWKEFGAGASRARAANKSDKFPPFHVRHRVSQGIVAVQASAATFFTLGPTRLTAAVSCCPETPNIFFQY
jgi:hypothetical protein